MRGRGQAAGPQRWRHADHAAPVDDAHAAHRGAHGPSGAATLVLATRSGRCGTWVVLRWLVPGDDGCG